MKSFLSGLLLFVFFVPSVPANETDYDPYCVHRVCFDRSIEVDGQPFELRSADTMSFFGLKAYSAAVYTAPEVTSTDLVLTGVPIRLEIYYHRHFDKESLTGAAQESLNHNPIYDQQQHEDVLNELNRHYQDVKKGDRYTLTLLPDVGMVLALNGQKQVVVSNPEFEKAYLGIWLSEYAFHEGMREDLLHWELLE